MHTKETQDFILAWAALSFAFGNLLGGLNIQSFFIAAITAGIGFLLHELAHRAVAERFGLSARFEADYGMLFFAILASFAGFIFAAPGSVVTRGVRSLRQSGLISAAGPATNSALAAIFFIVPGVVGNYGMRINAFLGLFNMIPFGGLDGESILEYSKFHFGLLVIVNLLLLAVSYMY